MIVAAPRLVRIGEAARMLGVSVQGMREWHRTGELVPARITRGGTRYYALEQLTDPGKMAGRTVAYARVSSRDQRADLDRQQEALEAFCAAKGWEAETIRDLGSGLNYRKKGLRRLLGMIQRREMNRLVLTHEDRLLRFGSEIVFDLCRANGIEVVVIHENERVGFEQELAADLIEIITVLSGRLHGRRSHRSKKMLAAVSAELGEADAE